MFTTQLNEYPNIFLETDILNFRQIDSNIAEARLNGTKALIEQIASIMNRYYIDLEECITGTDGCYRNLVSYADGQKYIIGRIEFFWYPFSHSYVNITSSSQDSSLEVRASVYELERYIKHLRTENSCSYCSRILFYISFCSSCKFSRYCSIECQDQDYEEHKLVCAEKKARNLSRDYERIEEKKYPSLFPLSSPETINKIPIPEEFDPYYQSISRKQNITLPSLCDLPPDVWVTINRQMDGCTRLMARLTCGTLNRYIRRSNRIDMRIRTDPRKMRIEDLIVPIDSVPLLEYWNNIKKTNKSLFTVWHIIIAIRSGSSNALNWLFLNVTDTIQYSKIHSAVIDAVAWGKVGVVEIIAKKYFTPVKSATFPYQEGRNIIKNAIRYKQVNILRMLMRLGHIITQQTLRGVVDRYVSSGLDEDMEAFNKQLPRK